MTKKEIQNLKTNRVTFFMAGALFALIGLFFIPFLLVGIILICLGWKANKTYKGSLRKSPVAQHGQRTPLEPVYESEVKVAAVEPVKVEEIPQEQYEKMRNMCANLHKEYVTLLKEYKDSDESGKVYILKECYRKLNVLDSIVSKYKCYYELDMYDEFEKIEKKAKSFINAYIKEQRESGEPDYCIDINQFSIDLYFIDDYIFSKDEKLNNI